jgi:hypothetical protein
MAQLQTSVMAERSTLWAVIVTLVTAGLGGFVLWCSSIDKWWIEQEHWQALARNFGSLLIASVALGLLWQLVGRRAFLDEILAKAGISKELSHAGVLQITDSFHAAIPWGEMLQNVKKLDLFVAYAQTWRQSHEGELKAVVTRYGTRTRVVLPDPEDESTLLEMAGRFACSRDDARLRVEQAITFFKNLSRVAGQHGATVKIWLYKGVPQFSFYRFDRTAILALYSHRRTRAPVPTIVARMGGTLYNFVREEFHALIDPEGLARPLLE